MFKIDVGDDVIAYSEDQVSRYNFGQRSHANGNKEEQTTGVIGQCVVMDMFGVGYVDGSSGFDNGIDISFNGVGLDVKTMGRTVDPRPEYTNNLMASQMSYDTDAYIFCSYNKKSRNLTVCGWLPKSEIRNVGRHYEKGAVRTRADKTTFVTKADMYEIDNSVLYEADTIDGLKSSIMSYYETICQ
jgi:hypothetical protein